MRRDLNDLAAFAAVARARSFTRAAAELGVSPSALSHGLRGLEARMGVRLLARTTRSVGLTGAGERLLASLAPALEQIAEGVVAARAHDGSRITGALRLTTFAYAAKAVLEPALPPFLLSHPEVQVEVSVNSALTDIVDAGFDAGIRLGETVEKDMISVRVGPDIRSAVAAAPAYLARRGAPQTPADLAAHNCVGYRMSTSGGLLPWEFERDGRAVNVRPSGGLVVSDGDLALAAVRAGVGVGYFMADQIAEDLTHGRLVLLLDGWCPDFPGCHLYHPSRRHASPALQALISHLKRTGRAQG
jgi:DNA-binding transcriptional LysR family regulator